jgi:kynurenine formamidase
MPRRGDILFIRTGMMPEWESFTEQQKKDYAAQEEAEHAGVEASIELLEWLWDSGITAVAGDAISWEVSRRREVQKSCSWRGPCDWLTAYFYQVFPTPGEVSMHEYLLGGWGLPIGTSSRRARGLSLCRSLTSACTKGKCSTSKRSRKPVQS